MSFYRTAFALGALAALSACAPKTDTAAAPSVQAPAPIAAEGKISRFKVGRLDAVALLDGEIKVANDGKVFGVGRPTSEVAELLAAAGLPQNELTLSIQPLMVRNGAQVLLFDTGAGAVEWAQGGKLPASLAAARVSPGRVTDIFISHAHPDHVGGLLAAGGGLAFPNATIHLSAPEWQAMKSNPGQAALVAAIGSKVRPFEPGAVILPNLVTAVPVNGHTPGHSAYQIASGDQRLLYIGDSAHHHVVSVRKPDWTIDYDGDAPTAEASRRALLQRAADQKLRLYAVHFPFPGRGRVQAQGDGFVWVPEPS